MADPYDPYFPSQKGKGEKMNSGTATVKYPVAIEKLPTDVELKTSWIADRLRDLKATTMTQPIKPYWNTTMVTAWVAVIGLVLLLLGSIGGLYVYTKNTYLQMGDQQGYQRRVQEETDETLKVQAEEINTLKKAAGLLPKEEKK